MSDNLMPVILLFGGLLISLGVVALFVLLNAKYLGFRMKGFSIEFAINLIMFILLAYSFTISITGLIEYIEPRHFKNRAEITTTKRQSILSVEELRTGREKTRPPAVNLGGPESIWKNF
ncbi:MAG: hypothetical protein IIA41_05000 [SAR324 cluster bacterium]|nr:hypothetical protein [SAR324 cluster bacterium]